MAAAALRPSPAALLRRSHLSPVVAAITTSASLRASPLPLRLRPLRLSSPPSLRRRRGATMMDTAAGSYASALADVAASTSTLDATAADMERLSTVFSDPGVLAFFSDPTNPVDSKLSLAGDIASQYSLQPHTANFLKIVVEMKRTDLFAEIAKEFEAVYNKITGTEVAVVSSVVPLESQHLAQIATQVQKLTKAQNVRIKTVIDPSLVAGFTIRYGSSGSKFIDMSVKKQLAEIASQLDFSNIALV